MNNMRRLKLHAQTQHSTCMDSFSLLSGFFFSPECHQRANINKQVGGRKRAGQTMITSSVSLPLLLPLPLSSGRRKSTAESCLKDFSTLSEQLLHFDDLVGVWQHCVIKTEVKNKKTINKTVFPITHNWGSITHRFQIWRASCYRALFQSNPDDRRRVWTDLQSSGKQNATGLIRIHEAHDAHMILKSWSRWSPVRRIDLKSSESKIPLV